MADRRLKLVTLSLRQLDNSNNLVYSASIPVGVEEHETFNDILKKMVESSDIASNIKEDIKRCLRNPMGDRGIIFYVIGENGERVALNLEEKVAEAARRYGTNQINMDIARIVGGNI